VQSAAQLELDSRKAALQVLSDQNDLFKQQLQLLERLAAASGAAAGAGPKPAAAKGGGAPVFKPFDIKPFDFSKLIPPDILGKWNTFVDSLLTARDKLSDFLKPITDALQHAKDAFDQKLPEMESHWKSTWDLIQADVDAIKVPTVQTVQGLVADIGKALDGLVTLWSTHYSSLATIQDLFTTTTITSIGLFITGLEGSFQTGMDILGGIAEVGWTVVKGNFTDFTDFLTGVFTGDWTKFHDDFTGNFTTFTDLIGSTWTKVWDAAKTASETDLTLIGNAFSSFKNTVMQATDPVSEAIGKVLSAVQTLFDFLQQHVFTFHINLPDLPKWATPGSPTPFEMGLRGISNALQGVANDMYSLRSAATAMGTVAPAINTSTYNNTTQFVYSPTYHSAPGPVSDNFATMSALWA
jgi:phage-related protein